MEVRYQQLLKSATEKLKFRTSGFFLHLQQQFKHFFRSEAEFPRLVSMDTSAYCPETLSSQKSNSTVCQKILDNLDKDKLLNKWEIRRENNYINPIMRENDLITYSSFE